MLDEAAEIRDKQGSGGSKCSVRDLGGGLNAIDKGSNVFSVRESAGGSTAAVSSEMVW